MHASRFDVQWCVCVCVCVCVVCVCVVCVLCVCVFVCLFDILYHRTHFIVGMLETGAIQTEWIL
jgi:hypothetical protein